MKLLRIVQISGSGIISEILPGLQVIFDWAEAEGYNTCEIYGSPAWEKLLCKHWDFEKKVVLRKSLGGT